MVALLSQFMNTDLSAFYFDIRKDALYCEPYSSIKRAAALEIDRADLPLHDALAGAAAVLHGRGGLARALSRPTTGSVHIELFPELPVAWRDDALAEKWETDQARAPGGHRRARDRAREQDDRLVAGSGAAGLMSPIELLAALEGVDLAEICITSAFDVIAGAAPAGAFTLAEVPGVGVVPKKAAGTKCARSWRITPDVGSDPDFPELSRARRRRRARVRRAEDA